MAKSNKPTARRTGAKAQPTKAQQEQQPKVDEETKVATTDVEQSSSKDEPKDTSADEPTVTDTPDAEKEDTSDKSDPVGDPQSDENDVPPAEDLASKAKEVAPDHPLVVATSETLSQFISVMGPMRSMAPGEASGQQTNLWARFATILRHEDAQPFSAALNLIRKTIQDNPENTFARHRVFRGIEDMRGTQAERRSYEMLLAWFLDAASDNESVRDTAKGKDMEMILSGARFSSEEMERFNKWANKYIQ